MKILETEHLILREIVESDAEFILDLLNQPSFIKYIGDRNVRNLEQAREFIESRFTKSYLEHGFGLYLVELKPEFCSAADAESEIQNLKSEIELPIGICGFVKRDAQPDADIGFAFLPQFCGKGFASEAAEAVMKFGKQNLNLERVLAITTQNNESSVKLLEKLNFKFERLIKMPHDAEKLNLFCTEI
jgi:RimJ/RimL family protein N-acetyltransferase